jgi:site-specific DNA recombinase
VAIYVRRSTDAEHQPFTIEAQDSKLRSYVKSQPGWDLVARFADDASGAILDRPGLAAALAAARAGRFDVLLVYRVDRFSRRIRDLVTLLDELDHRTSRHLHRGWPDVLPDPRHLRRYLKLSG